MHLKLTFLALVLFATILHASDDAPIATILCYHEVDDVQTHATVPRKSATGSTSAEQLRYTITTAQFNEQLDFLERGGYHVISLGELADRLSGRTKVLPERAVVITVDDGWLCAFTNIAPIMARRGLPFTLFVYPNIVGRGAHAVNWSQVKQLARAPNVEIGSHTMTHPFLTRRNNAAAAEGDYDSFLKAELDGSRRHLCEILDRPVSFLSYPYGDFDDEVLAAAANAGYVAAVTTQRGPISAETPLLQLRRYLIHNDTTLEEFRTFLPR